MTSGRTGKKKIEEMGSRTRGTREERGKTEKAKERKQKSNLR